MIAITGATGHLGQHVIHELMKRIPPSQIVAVVRNPAKAQALKNLGVQVRQADYDEAESLKQALQGIRQVLLISSSEMGRRETQHANVIAAAQLNGIRHLAYTSLLRADTSPMGLAREHVATELLIEKSGLPFTLLRNGWYLENHTENLASAIESGVLLGAAGDGRFSSASRLDYARAAVEVLTTPGHENKVYELGGSEAFTLAELAQKISFETGKPLQYRDLPEVEYQNLLMNFGLPEAFAHLLADSDAGARKGALFTESRDLETLLGRRTTTMAEALHSALKPQVA